MSDLKHVEAAIAAAEIKNVEQLLGDLELGEDTTTDVIEHVGEHIGELDAVSEDAVEAAVARVEAYEEQPETVTSVEAPAAAVTEPVTEKKARKAKTAKVAKVAKPKVERDLTALPNDTFVLAGETATAANSEVVIAMRPKQKKIAEKFDNLFQSIAAGRKPSIYTMVCLQALNAKGEVAQADLVSALQTASVGIGKTKGSTYNIGTARSQAGQMMVLFDLVGIAKRVKQNLTFNKDSTLATKLLA